mmetsp:Transcript_1698/g.2814  ORF Transcript_1698/g.2814 Transcript_1698/m.2814 type:complete len:311 (-) Transcript_1698:72-1004(-)
MIGDSIIGHVNRAVRQGLDDPNRVPRQIRSQAKLSRAGPFLQPSNSILVPSQSTGVVRIEGITQHMFLDRFRPRFLAISKIPLIGGSDHALIVRTTDDPRFWFIVQAGLPSIDHFLLDDGFDVTDLFALVGPNRHHTHSEALEISLVLGLLQLGLVIEGFDFELSTHENGGCLSVPFNRNNRHDFKGKNHFICDAVFGAKVGLLLQGLEGHIIVRSITRDRSYDACSLGHANGQQREGVDLFVLGQGCLEWQSQKFVTLEGFQAINFAKFFGVPVVALVHLTGQATSGSCTHDKHFVRCIDIVSTVISIW